MNSIFLNFAFMKFLFSYREESKKVKSKYVLKNKTIRTNWICIYFAFVNFPKENIHPSQLYENNFF